MPQQRKKHKPGGEAAASTARARPFLYKALVKDRTPFARIFRYSPRAKRIVVADKQQHGRLKPFADAYNQQATMPGSSQHVFGFAAFIRAEVSKERRLQLERRFRKAATYARAVAISSRLEDPAKRRGIGLWSNTRDLIDKDPAFAEHYLAKWWHDHARHAIHTILQEYKQQHARRADFFKVRLELDGGAEARLEIAHGKLLVAAAVSGDNHALIFPIDDKNHGGAAAAIGSWLDVLFANKKSLVYTAAQQMTYFRHLGALEVLDVIDFLNLAKRRVRVV